MKRAWGVWPLFSSMTKCKDSFYFTTNLENIFNMTRKAACLGKDPMTVLWLWRNIHAQPPHVLLTVSVNTLVLTRSLLADTSTVFHHNSGMQPFAFTTSAVLSVRSQPLLDVLEPWRLPSAHKEVITAAQLLQTPVQTAHLAGTRKAHLLLLPKHCWRMLQTRGVSVSTVTTQDFSKSSL